jgi:hypothetical protein
MKGRMGLSSTRTTTTKMIFSDEKKRLSSNHHSQSSSQSWNVHVHHYYTEPIRAILSTTSARGNAEDHLRLTRVHVQDQGVRMRIDYHAVHLVRLIRKGLEGKSIICWIRITRGSLGSRAPSANPQCKFLMRRKRS